MTGKKQVVQEKNWKLLNR